MKKVAIGFFLLISIFIFADQLKFSLRKYSHVKKFYASISEEVVNMGLKYKVPPAAILAIAGLESGYDSGYVGRITGNIMSLAAGKSEKKLPRLYLPKHNERIIYDSLKYQKIANSKLEWKMRPPSYKKDYRPTQYAGTSHYLNYFDFNKDEKLRANLKNIDDFMSKWLKIESKKQPFADGRIYLNKVVQEKGIEILFDLETNLKFIDLIGGRPDSYNTRKSWNKKLKIMIKNLGLINLTKEIHYNKKSFEEAWTCTEFIQKDF